MTLPAHPPTGFNLQPTLDGSLLRMRPLAPDDYESIFAVAADKLAWEQHPVPTRHQEDVFSGYFEDCIASGGQLLAIDKATDKVIGWSRFAGYDATASEIEIGWTFLGRAFWGGTYNGEMKRLMLVHAYQRVETVVFRIGEKNMRSQRAVLKIGARQRGTEFSVTGIPTLVYELTRPMYETRQMRS